MANCSDITKYGIFDISQKSKSEDLITSYLKWLSNQEYESSEQTRNSSFNIGITLPKLPVEISLGGGGAGGSSSSWGKSLTEYLAINTAARTQFNEEFRQANSKIIEAWSSCVINKRGLSCWAEQTDDPRVIALKIDVKLLVIPMLHELEIKEIVTSSHVQPKEKVEGEKIGAETITILYERTGPKWFEAVSFDVETNDPNYQDSCSAPEILVMPVDDDGKAMTGRAVDGLVAKWTGNGNAHDLLNKYHGAATKVTYVEGIYDKAFKFTSEAASRIVTPLTLSYQNGATFSAWVRTNSDRGVIIADGGGSSADIGMGFFIEPGGNIMLSGSRAVPGDGNFGILGGQAVNDNEFHHLAGTWTGRTNPDEVAFYIDGEPVGYATAKQSVSKASTHICMGGHDLLAYYPDFNGTIDDVSVYERVLSAEEIKIISKR